MERHLRELINIRLNEAPNIELSLGEDRQPRGLPGHRAVETAGRERGGQEVRQPSSPHPPDSYQSCLLSATLQTPVPQKYSSSPTYGKARVECGQGVTKRKSMAVLPW